MTDDEMDAFLITTVRDIGERLKGKKIAFVAILASEQGPSTTATNLTARAHVAALLEEGLTQILANMPETRPENKEVIQRSIIPDDLS